MSTDPRPAGGNSPQLETEIDRQRVAVTASQARVDRLYDVIEANLWAGLGEETNEPARP